MSVFTLDDYQKAMETFTIERVRERLEEDSLKLNELQNKPYNRDIRTLVSPSGSIMFMPTDENTRRLNIQTLEQNIEFWRNILEWNSKTKNH